MKRIDDVFFCIKNKIISKEGTLAFKAAFAVGIIAHIYMFTNKLPNYDDVYTLDGFGATFRLGRWFLWILGAAAYHLELVISLPWINGLFSILLIAVSAGLMAELFQLKSKMGNLLLGAALVVFPAWTSTFFFMFTAPYYAFAVFLTTCAVYLSVRAKWGNFYAVVLIALSLGIYQAYLPFAATLYVVILFLMLFDDNIRCGKIFKRAFCHFCSLIFGVCVYCLITKISLMLRGEELSSYKGVSGLGGFSLVRIPEIWNRIVKNMYGVFMDNNLEISYNLLTKGMYFVLFLCSVFCIVLLLMHLYKEKTYGKMALVVLFLAAFEIAMNGIFIMCDEGIYSLMYYSFVFLMIFPVCLLDRCFVLGENKVLNCVEGIMVLVLMIGIGSYCHYANAQYLSIQLSFEQAESYFNTLITQIKSVEGYSDELAIVFAGQRISDNTMYQNEVMDRFSMSGRDNTLIDAYSREAFMRYYCGFSPEYADIGCLNRETIEAMPVYPDYGSIQIVDGVIVIKLENDF